jgi:hypothetical protein
MCGIWQAEYSVNCSRRVSQKATTATALDRGHALPGGTDLARHLDRSIERFADVDIDQRLEEHVVGPVLVDQGNTGLACFQHVVDGRQLLQIETDRLRMVLGLRPGRADAHGHQFADITDLVGSERRLFRHLETAQAGNRTDRFHANQLGCRERGVANFVGNANAAKAGVRGRTARESHVLHAGQPDVGNELPTAAHEAVVFLSGEASSDTL